MSNILTLLVVLMLVISLTACAGMSTREQRMLSGGAVGAAGGAALGGITGGSAAAGAAIGGAAGVVGGYLYDEHTKKKR